jgi:hypothetical protein
LSHSDAILGSDPLTIFPSRMEEPRDYDVRTTCLGTGPHGHAISDNTLHYYGCLRESDRRTFYDSLDDDARRLITNEGRRVRNLRRTLEVDTEKRYLISSLKMNLSHWRQSRRIRNMTADLSRAGEVAESLGPPDENAYGFSASMILFRNAMPYTHPDFDGTFPNQEIPVNELFYNKDERKNPLMRPCERDMIRYFHLPANNMIWLEVSTKR